MRGLGGAEAELEGWNASEAEAEAVEMAEEALSATIGGFSEAAALEAALAAEKEEGSDSERWLTG